jgi:hypothetical protein
MTNSLGPIREFVGVDVSQDRLDVCLLPGSTRAGFSRDRRGIARLVAWLASRERLLVVAEATGGLERPLTAATKGPLDPRLRRGVRHPTDYLVPSARRLFIAVPVVCHDFPCLQRAITFSVKG